MSICMKNEKVPLPRQSIYTEFPEFSKGQIQLFTQIFFTFLDSRNGDFRVDELSFLMRQLGHPLDQLSLRCIFEKVDEDNDGMLSLREFLNLFRLAAEDELWNAVFVLKILVHVFQVGGKEVEELGPGISNNVCKKCRAKSEVDDAAEHVVVVKKLAKSKPKKRSILFRLAKMIETAFESTFTDLN